ncbi:MAG: hypothetical protein JWN80_2257 [Microbacteriaceae bacterium]|jgi:hypothetical protein|nr:hypothetical protein [Microbacteriaceae bacterium]
MSKLRDYLRLDFPWGSAQPGPVRFVAATIVAVAGSVVACWILAKVAVLAMPSTAGYEHFQFADYTRLTIIGVVVACISWPLTTLLSSRARRLFFWLAVIVTVASLAPDVWIIHQGQPLGGVVVLMLMHFALAVVTYPVLVFGAPQRRKSDPAGVGEIHSGGHRQLP